MTRRKHHICLSVHAIGHFDTIPLSGHHRRDGKDRTGDGEECTIDIQSWRIRLRQELVPRRQQEDGVVGPDGASRAEDELWESFYRQGRIGRRAGNDEGGGEGVDFVEIQGSVEGCGKWGFLEGGSEVGAVAGFNGENRAGIGEVCFIEDGGRRTELRSLLALGDRFRERIHLHKR